MGGPLAAVAGSFRATSAACRATGEGRTVPSIGYWSVLLCSHSHAQRARLRPDGIGSHECFRLVPKATHASRPLSTDAAPAPVRNIHGFACSKVSVSAWVIGIPTVTSAPMGTESEPPRTEGERRHAVNIRRVVLGGVDVTKARIDPSRWVQARDYAIGTLCLDLTKPPPARSRLEHTSL